MKRNCRIVKNKLGWTTFIFEEDAEELAEQMQEQDKANHTYKAREMTTSELGENDDTKDC